MLTVVHETPDKTTAPEQEINVSISSGEFTGTFNMGGTADVTKNDTMEITGGTFSTDPSGYVASGYEAKAGDDGTWTVSEKVD